MCPLTCASSALAQSGCVFSAIWRLGTCRLPERRFKESTTVPCELTISTCVPTQRQMSRAICSEVGAVCHVRVSASATWGAVSSWNLRGSDESNCDVTAQLWCSDVTRAENKSVSSGEFSGLFPTCLPAYLWKAFGLFTAFAKDSSHLTWRSPNSSSRSARPSFEHQAVNASWLSKSHHGTVYSSASGTVIA